MDEEISMENTDQERIAIQSRIDEIDKKISELESSIPAIQEKYKAKALSDKSIEEQIASNRAKRIKKDNSSLIQWNWQKAREDAEKAREDSEKRYQDSLASSKESQTRMKVNGAASDIRTRQSNIANDFRQMEMTVDPFQRKAYENKILADLDQMRTSYETLAKTYSEEELAQFGLSNMDSYVENVKKAIEEGKFSAGADFAQVVEIQTEYEHKVRSGTLSDADKNSYLTALAPLVEKGSKEAFALKQEILGGETSKETFAREVQANSRERAIQKGNEKDDANRLTLDELLAKPTLNIYEQKALDRKYTQKMRQADADAYKGMSPADKTKWRKRNTSKFNLLRNKGLL